MQNELLTTLLKQHNNYIYLKYIGWLILNLINKNSLTLALTSSSDCTNISVCHILSYLSLSSKSCINPLGFA